MQDEYDRTETQQPDESLDIAQLAQALGAIPRRQDTRNRRLLWGVATSGRASRAARRATGGHPAPAAGPTPYRYPMHRPAQCSGHRAAYRQQYGAAPGPSRVPHNSLASDRQPPYQRPRTVVATLPVGLAGYGVPGSTHQPRTRYSRLAVCPSASPGPASSTPWSFGPN